MNKDKQVFCFQDNAFDLIRYWAAICVMFLHYYGICSSFVRRKLIIYAYPEMGSIFFPRCCSSIFHEWIPYCGII